MSPPVHSLAAALARLAPGTGSRCVLLAASGGPDSAGLLAAYAALPLSGRPAAVVVHVDHGLHPDAGRAAAAACRQAARLGLPVRLVQLEPDAAPDQPFGSEAWSRAARYRLLARLARAEGARAVVTAHHREDQLETLLLQLLRGAGTRGLGGMRAARALELEGDVQLLRPFLMLPRRLLAEQARAGGLAELVVDDPTNHDQRFLRNRLRHGLLPGLLQELGPEGAELLAELGRQLRRAADLQAGCVAQLRQALVSSLADGGVSFDAAGLGRLPPALRAALVLDGLHRLDRSHEPRRVHVHALLGLAGRAAGGPVARPRYWCLPGGCWARAGRAELSLHPPGPGGPRPRPRNAAPTAG